MLTWALLQIALGLFGGGEEEEESRAWILWWRLACVGSPLLCSSSRKDLSIFVSKAVKGNQHRHQSGVISTVKLLELGHSLGVITEQDHPQGAAWVQPSCFGKGGCFMEWLWIYVRSRNVTAEASENWCGLLLSKSTEMFMLSGQAFPLAVGFVLGTPFPILNAF